MRIYEAESKSYLQNFDRVVVRIFKRSAGGSDDHSNSTPLIGVPVSLEAEESDDATEDIPMGKNSQEEPSQDETMKDDNGVDNNEQNQKQPVKAEEEEIFTRIRNAVQELEDRENSSSSSSGRKKKKKTSAATEKVRQILIKGKAKGDKKIALKDRFYLEVVHVHVNNNTSYEASLTKVFYSKFDQVSKCICVHTAGNGGGGRDGENSSLSFEIFKLTAPVDANGQTATAPSILTRAVVPMDMRFMDMEGKGIVTSFDRIIVREQL